MNDRMRTSEQLVRSAGDEMKHFMHQIHGDFENFQRRHREEHIDINKKLLNLQEVSQRNMVNTSVHNQAA